MKLSNLFRGLGIHVEGYDPEITGLTHDSSRVARGSLFVAVKGFRTDGHLYAAKALESGAAAVLADDRDYSGQDRVFFNNGGNNRELLAVLAARFFEEPWNSMLTAGITGTNGKTSTARMLSWILQSRGISTGIMGTVGHVVAGQPVPADVTTPDSLETARLMRDMVNGGDRACVMEASSHALSLARVDMVRFDVAVFTNLSQDHLDFHGSMEEYLKAKLRLLDLLKPAGTPVLGSASKAWPRVSGALNFGYGESDDFRILDGEAGIEGCKYTLHSPDGRQRVTLSAPGVFSIVNSAGAIAAAWAMGVPVEQSKEALVGFPGVPGRMERVEGSRGFLVAVDYAHTPDALERVLLQGRELAEGRLISVFGCGGDRDPGKRPQMGAISGRLADLSIVTSDNPRTEDPILIIGEILAGLGNRSSVIVEPDRRMAIRRAVAEAGQGDVVIIAGKGHEDYQILKTGKIHFDDREEARAALRELP